MAKLSDIQYSLNSETESKPTENEHIASQLARSESVEPVSDIVIFKLLNTNRKGRLYIDGVDDVWNKETNSIERIRLLSGVSSIWLKDQKNVSEEYVKLNRRSLLFEGKICRVPSHDTTALEFARTCRHFVDNPNRKTGSKHEFFEWNPKRQAEEQLRRRTEKINAMKKAIEISEKEPAKMRKHAAYLGILPYDEYGVLKSDESIANDYVGKAEENARHFLDTLENPVVEIAYMVKKALSEAKIDLGRQKGAAFWANGGFITNIPPTKQAHQHLIDLALTNSEEGKNFIEHLRVIIG